MNQTLLSALALTAGVLLAVQSGYSAQLGAILKKPILASASTYATGALLATAFVFVFSKEGINLQTARQVPWYLWFIGGLFSVTGVTFYYFLIPKIGITKMIAIGLCGQLLFSVVAGHFGWLNLPGDPITFKKLMGVLAMIVGIFLINLK
ncbi:DMT family transporter [Algoriphagus sp. NG3]|uniref:DMT family transporter n=1 Tax=Algoriphagus sp. NG3 TaxID=3097546 RepID=UPI002A7EF1AB|nr:DMT family transporter [Algoriphagus sp. NG3]WPR77352.1 DMT family transporter [Algoriphagus sp. NG3]